VRRQRHLAHTRPECDFAHLIAWLSVIPRNLSSLYIVVSCFSRCDFRIFNLTVNDNSYLILDFYTHTHIYIYYTALLYYTSISYCFTYCWSKSSYSMSFFPVFRIRILTSHILLLSSDIFSIISRLKYINFYSFSLGKKAC
jgi:hypothetical protein